MFNDLRIWTIRLFTCMSMFVWEYVSKFGELS